MSDDATNGRTPTGDSTARGEGPDYAALLRSPYDPDPEHPPRSEGTSELPWIPAVVAACIGALVVGAYVVFAIVTGPDAADAEDTAATTTTTAATPPAQRSDSLPDGFTAVTDDVGVSVVDIDVSSRGTIVTVATAVRGGLDPGAVAPLDVAYWTLVNDGSEIPMRSQDQDKIGIGNTTVEFPPQLALRRPTLVPHVAVGSPTVELYTIELEPTYPQVLEPFTVEVGDVTVTIEELSFSDSWGWVAWSTVGGVAKVDPTITFLGTDDPGGDGITPTLLVPLSRVPFSIQGPSRPLPEPYGWSGSESLLRSGEPIAGDNVPTGIRIDLAIEVPGDVAPATPIDLAPTG